MVVYTQSKGRDCKAFEDKHVVFRGRDSVDVKQVRGRELDMVFSVSLYGQQLVSLSVLNSEDVPK